MGLAYYYGWGYITKDREKAKMLLQEAKDKNLNIGAEELKTLK